MRLPETFRAAAVIARRDISATVLSKTFLFFLLGPLFPILFGFGFASIGASVDRASTQPTVAVVSSANDYLLLRQQRDRLDIYPGEATLIELAYVAPQGDPAAQREKLLGDPDKPVVGVLEGGLFAPHFTGVGKADGRTVKQLRLIVEQAQMAQSGAMPMQRLTLTHTDETAGSVSFMRGITARAGQAVIFFLTVLLAGMLLSQLIEEKANKVIEVLASAVPIDAIFLGKLVAMLVTSLIGIALWTSLGAFAIGSLADKGLAALPVPAVGWPAFLLLTLAYFSMAYLLIGAVFLGIGAHASTPREVQILSMPVTMAQLILFGFASLAVSQPDSQVGLAAAIFPLSSPLAMIARAAELPELWPHLLAILWQFLWVAIILRLAARFFRRSVLKSGGTKRLIWWRTGAALASIRRDQ